MTSLNSDIIYSEGVVVSVVVIDRRCAVWIKTLQHENGLITGGLPLPNWRKGNVTAHKAKNERICPIIGNLDGFYAFAVAIEGASGKCTVSQCILKVPQFHLNIPEGRAVIYDIVG